MTPPNAAKSQTPLIDAHADFRVYRQPESPGLFGVLGNVRGYDESEATDSTDGYISIGEFHGLYAPHVGSADDLYFMTDPISDNAASLTRLPWLDPGADVLSLAGPHGEMPVHAWLAFTSVYIKPPFRGRHASYQALRDCIEAFSSQCFTLVVTKPHPLGSSEDEPVPEVEAAREKLQQHWHRFGLRPIDGTPLYAHSLEFCWPSGSWMAEQDARFAT